LVVLVISPLPEIREAEFLESSEKYAGFLKIPVFGGLRGTFTGTVG
jgi:hypothetical protein